MKSFFEKIASFIKREWFLLVMLGAISLIIFIFRQW